MPGTITVSSPLRARGRPRRPPRRMWTGALIGTVPDAQGGTRRGAVVRVTSSALIPPLVIGAPQLRPAVPRPTSVLGMARESRALIRNAEVEDCGTPPVRTVWSATHASAASAARLLPSSAVGNPMRPSGRRAVLHWLTPRAQAKR